MHTTTLLCMMSSDTHLKFVTYRYQAHYNIWSKERWEKTPVRAQTNIRPYFSSDMILSPIYFSATTLAVQLSEKPDQSHHSYHHIPSHIAIIINVIPIIDMPEQRQQKWWEWKGKGSINERSEARTSRVDIHFDEAKGKEKSLYAWAHYFPSRIVYSYYWLYLYNTLFQSAPSLQDE